MGFGAVVIVALVASLGLLFTPNAKPTPEVNDQQVVVLDLEQNNPDGMISEAPDATPEIEEDPKQDAAKESPLKNPEELLNEAIASLYERTTAEQEQLRQQLEKELKPEAPFLKEIRRLEIEGQTASGYVEIKKRNYLATIDDGGVLRRPNETDVSYCSRVINSIQAKTSLNPPSIKEALAMTIAQELLETMEGSEFEDAYRKAADLRSKELSIQQKIYTDALTNPLKYVAPIGEYLITLRNTLKASGSWTPPPNFEENIKSVTKKQIEEVSFELIEGVVERTLNPYSPKSNIAIAAYSQSQNPNSQIASSGLSERQIEANQLRLIKATNDSLAGNSVSLMAERLEIWARISSEGNIESISEIGLALGFLWENRSKMSNAVYRQRIQELKNAALNCRIITEDEANNLFQY